MEKKYEKLEKKKKENETNHIFDGATKSIGTSTIGHFFFSKAEIGDSDMAESGEKYIFRFKIAMDNILAMEMIQSEGKLSDIESDMFFREHSFFSEVMKERAAAHKVHDQIDPAGSLKGKVERDDERMTDFA